MIKKDLLQDNTLIICPNNCKENFLNLLSESKQIINVKFMTIEEYKKNYLFDYDERAIEYLYRKHNLNPANAKELIENLYYIDEKKNYISKKLNDLISLKKELNSLLIFNPLFSNYLSKFKIVVYGYGQLDKFYQSIINGKIIPFDLLDHNQIIYEFNDIEEEMEYLFTEIENLLNNGTDINDIIIANVNKEYIPYIKRFEKYYGIKIQYNENNSIIGTSLVKDFIGKLDNQSASEIYDWLNTYNSPLSSTLISILNKYSDFDDLNTVKELIKEDLLHVNIKRPKLKNALKTINIFDEVQDNQHLFFIGFNDNIPALYRDNEYITDNIRFAVNRATTHELNKINKENIISWLSQISNLHLSYCKKSPFASYSPSIISKEKNYSISNDYQFQKNYSEKLLLRKYSSLLDNYRKYNDPKDKKLIEKYYSKFEKADYLSYNNSFNKFDFSLDGLHLSYSSLSTFYKCPFRYYLSYILKLNDNEKTFDSEVGTAIHEVLKNLPIDDFKYDIKKIFDQEINKLDQSLISNERNAVFVEVIKDNLPNIVNFIMKHRKVAFQDTGLKEMHEKTIELKNVANDTDFKGIIDKIMYTEENGKIYIAIIDYKTGSFENPKLEEVPYGFSLQLPIYMYLVSKAVNENLIPQFKNKQIVFCGFYIQTLLNKIPNADHKNDLDNLRFKDLKLKGYSSSIRNRMAKFDPDIIGNKESTYISSLKFKNNNEPMPTSRVFDDSNLNKTIDDVNKVITEAAKQIHDGNFIIQPKKIGNNDRSCEYCPFSGICYKRYENYLNITISDNNQEEE